MNKAQKLLDLTEQQKPGLYRVEHHKIVKKFKTKDGGTAEVAKMPNGKFTIWYEGKDLKLDFTTQKSAESEAKKLVGKK